MQVAIVILLACLICCKLAQRSQATEVLNVLPFIQLSENASNFTVDEGDLDEGVMRFQFPIPFYFGNTTYGNASIVTNGYISFEDSPISDSDPTPRFPLADGIRRVAPYWDDIDLSMMRGNIRYEIFGAESIVSKAVSYFIGNATDGVDFIATSVVIIYWENVCSFTSPDCTPANSNSFQVVFATSSDTSFTIFTYFCDRLVWFEAGATIGYSGNDTFFYEHPVSGQENVNDIACMNSVVSNWTNVVFNSKTGTVFGDDMQGPSSDAVVNEFRPVNESSGNVPDNEETNTVGTVCTNDCNSIDSGRIVECCDPSNVGKFLQVQNGAKRSYFACPISTPDWCT